MGERLQDSVNVRHLEERNEPRPFICSPPLPSIFDDQKGCVCGTPAVGQLCVLCFITFFEGYTALAETACNFLGREIT